MLKKINNTEELFLQKQIANIEATLQYLSMLKYFLTRRPSLAELGIAFGMTEGKATTRAARARKFLHYLVRLKKIEVNPEPQLKDHPDNWQAIINAYWIHVIAEAEAEVFIQTQHLRNHHELSNVCPAVC